MKRGSTADSRGLLSSVSSEPSLEVRSDLFLAEKQVGGCHSLIQTDTGCVLKPSNSQVVILAICILC